MGGASTERRLYDAPGHGTNAGRRFVAVLRGIALVLSL
jgi:hypothetical protein